MPTATPSAAQTVSAPAGAPDVRIACVFYDGVVSRQELDEYVEIANVGDEAQDMDGWRLVDIADETPVFAFPATLLGPGARVRVYTNEVHAEWGGFSFGRGSAIWSNSDPDRAGLYDGAGVLVSSVTYPPGCE